MHRSKRPRALQACDVCRTRKNRCSEDRPCIYCVEHGLECVYSRPGRDKRVKIATTPQSAGQIGAPVSVWTSNGQHAESMSSWAVDRDHIPDADKFVTGARRSESTSLVQSGNEASKPAHFGEDVNNLTDVMDTNLHTRNLEFYGSASLVAFLRDIQTMSGDQISASGRSLASLLHNTEFRPNTSVASPSVATESGASKDRYHFRIAKQFLDAYFSNIHYIQPLFDKATFYTRCEDLWFNEQHKQPLTFVALYYAAMSLGCLVMTAEDSDNSEFNRFAWSRRLFDEATALVTRLGTATDIEMAQCLYMLGKVCQHELNPHVAYLYAGQAARIGLAIGINRAGTSRDATDPRSSMAASQTWWAIYCLDIQTSFALGRPDSLGPDQCHTQILPTMIPRASISEVHPLQLVPPMVSLSRVMRKVALDLYSQPMDTGERLRRAKALDAELEEWAARLPAHLRRAQAGPSNEHSLKPQRQTSYIHKQSVVIRLRYLNLRMILHAVSINAPDILNGDQAAMLRECRSRCIQSAEDTVNLIYEVFATKNYFQTWWYNATYILFAVSVLLAVIFRQLAGTREALEKIYADIDNAVAILQAMDDCVVTRNAIAIIKSTLARARKVTQSAVVAQCPSSLTTANPANETCTQNSAATSLPDPHVPSQLSAPFTEPFDSSLSDIDWLSEFPVDAGQQPSFWTEWALELDMLGT